MVDSIFHDFKRIQKSEDSVVHREKQEDAEHDARGTFGLIHDMKSCRVKNLEGCELPRNVDRLLNICAQQSVELASSTLRSIALNYIQRASPNPVKALVKALNRLKKRDDIVITEPAKGSEVVVMDKPEYIRLLSAASVDNNSKFSHVDNLLSTQNVSNY